MLTRLQPRHTMLLLLVFSHAAMSGEKPKLKAEANPYKLHLSDSADYRLYNASYAPSSIEATPVALGKKPYAKEIEAAARASKLDPALVHALIHVESRHRQDAISAKGAIGLMQVLPETALRFGVEEPTQVRANLRAGTRYLRMLLDLYDQRLDLALSAYNAGEGAVARYGGIPPFAETQAYVPAVLDTYTAWRGVSSTSNQARMMR